MARLFFAVWPDAQAADALAELAARMAGESGGKPMPAAKIHLTLAFLGSVGDAERELAIGVAGRMRGKRFEAAVDRLGSFRRARVAWAGMSQPPARLLALQSSLERGLRERGFALDDRPFAPHVTLARNARKAVAPREIDPITWQVEALTLVRSETGTGTYVVERRWELG